MQRGNVVTIKGNAVTLLGDEVKIGQKAQDFKALNTSLEEVTLSDFKNKIKLIASVPSLDTPVCDLEIKRFNDEASKLSKDMAIIFISMDLPFAQKRFCQANEIKIVKTLSDHRDADFGQKFGVLIKEMRLLARAIFILDKADVIRYIQVVPELTSPPDYDAALRVLKEIVGGVNMKKYRCIVCGYIYDPADNNNVAFGDLPDDWVCPECGVGKDQFEEL